MLIYCFYSRLLTSFSIFSRKLNRFCKGINVSYLLILLIRWDYKTAELPGYAFNLSTAFIDFFAWLGWATELKTVPEDILKNRVIRTGDGTHSFSKLKASGSDNNNNVDEDDGERDIEHFWGFGDDTMTKRDMKNIKIL